MLLKGCQFHAAMTDSEVDQKVEYFSKKIRHRLNPLWEWFKKQPGRPIDELKKYDEVIDGLNEFDSLRYPSNTVPLKIGFHFSGLSLPPHAKPTGGPPNLYKLEMEPLDELVRIIFEAEGVNPKLLLFVRNEHSQKYLIPQNKCADFWIMWPV